MSQEGVSSCQEGLGVQPEHGISKNISQRVSDIKSPPLG